MDVLLQVLNDVLGGLEWTMRSRPPRGAKETDCGATGWMREPSGDQ